MVTVSEASCYLLCAFCRGGVVAHKRNIFTLIASSWLIEESPWKRPAGFNRRCLLVKRVHRGEMSLQFKLRKNQKNRFQYIQEWWVPCGRARSRLEEGYSQKRLFEICQVCLDGFHNCRVWTSDIGQQFTWCHRPPRQVWNSDLLEIDGAVRFAKEKLDESERNDKVLRRLRLMKGDQNVSRKD